MLNSKTKRNLYFIVFVVLLVGFAMGIAKVVMTMSDSARLIVRDTGEGFDVSHHQGTIDWKQVAGTCSVSYVYIKATEGGSWQDSCYIYNVREAKKAGLLVGAYHFFHTNVSLDMQFRNMTSVIKREDIDLVPIIDVEPMGCSNCDSAELRQRLEKFMQMVENYYGKKPMLYTSVKFYNDHFSGSSLRNYPLMIAYYNGDEPQLKDGNRYAVWQYTHHGSIQGVPGDVDRSRLMHGFALPHLAL